jgi:hypothetical protein
MAKMRAARRRREATAEPELVVHAAAERPGEHAVAMGDELEAGDALVLGGSIIKGAPLSQPDDKKVPTSTLLPQPDDKKVPTGSATD